MCSLLFSQHLVFSLIYMLVLANVENIIRYSVQMFGHILLLLNTNCLNKVLWYMFQSLKHSFSFTGILLCIKKVPSNSLLNSKHIYNILYHLSVPLRAAAAWYFYGFTSIVSQYAAPTFPYTDVKSPRTLIELIVHWPQQCTNIIKWKTMEEPL